MRRGVSHRVIVVAVLLSLFGAATSALAAWATWGGGAGNSKARTMPEGQTPTVAVTGRSAVVTWLPSQFPNGVNVDDYKVSRHDAMTGVEQTVGSSCAGTIAALTCTEEVLPPGDWKYAITPRKGNWVGAQSVMSDSFTIGSAILSFTPPTDVTTLETTLVGNISNFIAGQSVEFRLDDPATGTVLASTVTPNSIPAIGTAAVTVTIPKGTADGTHTVYAIGNQGDVASRPINVNVPPPTPTALTTTNVGQTGRPDQGDSFIVTYSQALDVGSLCTDWSGDSINQTINADGAVAVRISNDAAASGNDQLDIWTEAGVCGGAFRFGTIDLGSPDFVTGATYWGGSGASKTVITWTPASRQLLVTLGARAFGNVHRVNTAVTATYTPDPAIRNTSWVPITGTVSNTAVQF